MILCRYGQPFTTYVVSCDEVTIYHANGTVETKPVRIIEDEKSIRILWDDDEYQLPNHPEPEQPEAHKNWVKEESG